MLVFLKNQEYHSWINGGRLRWNGTPKQSYHQKTLKWRFSALFFFIWNLDWHKNTFGVLLMQNQFVQIKVLKILYQKKENTLTQTLNSNYGGHFKLSVWIGAKMDKHRIRMPHHAWSKMWTFCAYFLKCRYYSFYRFSQWIDWFNI